MARLIDANALLKAMDERYKEIETEKQYPFASDEERGLTAGFCEVDELVNNQPTVDAVEVVRGEWITKCMEGSWTHYRYSCSNCGSGFDSNSNYCPNCGADMRGEKNASD